MCYPSLIWNDDTELIKPWSSVQNVYSKKLLSDDITTVSANELQFYTSLSATLLQVSDLHVTHMWHGSDMNLVNLYYMYLYLLFVDRMRFKFNYHYVQTFRIKVAQPVKSTFHLT